MSKLYLFSYLNNNRYNIDNSITEHFIRPLAGECENSLFFLSVSWQMSQQSIIRCCQHAE